MVKDHARHAPFRAFILIRVGRGFVPKRVSYGGDEQAFTLAHACEMREKLKAFRKKCFDCPKFHILVNHFVRDVCYVKICVPP